MMMMIIIIIIMMMRKREKVKKQKIDSKSALIKWLTLFTTLMAFLLNKSVPYERICEICD